MIRYVSKSIQDAASVKAYALIAAGYLKFYLDVKIPCCDFIFPWSYWDSELGVLP